MILFGSVILNLIYCARLSLYVALATTVYLILVGAIIVRSLLILLTKKIKS